MPIEISIKTAEEECAVLLNLGIDARALERDGEPLGWGIAIGPIRWVEFFADDFICWIPDSRISSCRPRVAVHAYKDFKDEFWYVEEDRIDKVGWGPIPLDNELSSRIADKLDHDTKVMGGFKLTDEVAALGV